MTTVPRWVETDGYHEMNIATPNLSWSNLIEPGRRPSEEGPASEGATERPRQPGEGADGEPQAIDDDFLDRAIGGNSQGGQGNRQQPPAQQPPPQPRQQPERNEPPQQRQQIY